MKTIKEYTKEGQDYQERVEAEHKAMLKAGRELAEQAKELALEHDMTFESAFAVVVEDEGNSELVRTYFAGARHQAYREKTYQRKG